MSFQPEDNDIPKIIVHNAHNEQTHYNYLNCLSRNL